MEMDKTGMASVVATLCARFGMALGILLLTCWQPLRAEFVPVFNVVQRAGTDSISDPRIVRAADGRATLVWVHGGRIERRVVNSDGTMGTVAQLPTLGHGNARDPAVAVDLQGRVLVAWEEGGRIVAHRLAANGGLTTTFLLSDAGDSTARHPSAAIDAAGIGAVAWERGSRVEAVRLAQSNAAPVSAARLLTGTHQASPPGVAVDNSGDATVVWRRSGAFEYRRLHNNGAIAGPALMSDPSPCGLTLPRIGGHPLAPTRPMLFARGLSTATCFSGQLMRRTPAGDDVSFPAGASPIGGLDNDPDHFIVVEPIGHHWSLWRQDLGDGQQVHAQRRFAGGSGFERAALTAAGAVDVSDPRIAVAPDGSAMVAWVETLAGTRRVRGRFLSATGQPASVFSFSPSGEDGSSPALAMMPHDRPALAWLRPSGGNLVLQATLDVAAPVCATPIVRTILADGAATVTPGSVCQGWLDGPPAVVEFTQLPVLGQVDVILGTIVYIADGGDYHEDFRFRVSGPGGQSNEVAVNIEVLDDSFVFLDGFESE
jgi:hypothetical protein